ncbi:MAG: hypothetical protein RL150_729 [Candidatus Parcubacteria bacterium]|jgi:peptidoglycan hydrolase-like protein with peptidoglycan-binding domain
MKLRIGSLALVVIAALVGLPQLTHAQADVSAQCTLIVRALEQGDESEEVLALEKFLKKQKYFKGTPNEAFDKKTKDAVIAFQLAEGIINRKEAKQAGLLTAPTRDKIAEKTCKKTEITGAGSCIYLTRALSVENNSELAQPEIRQLQRLLVRKNYLSSTDVTGFFGPVTRQALIQFQLDNKIITSRTQEAAGILTARTREFIQENTCGSADIKTTASSTVSSFAAGVNVRKGLVVDDVAGEDIMTLTVTPKEKNAALASLRIRVESDDDEVTPAQRIDYIDVYKQGKGIVSRNRAAANSWNEVASSTYDIVLDGDQTMLEPRTESKFAIRVVPKRSELAKDKVNFNASIPENGLRLQFDTVTGANAGIQTWGSAGTEATFSIGGRVTSGTGTTTSNTTGGTATTTGNGTTTVPAADPVVKAPVLNDIRPAKGPFGTAINLVGKNFAATGNHIEIFHPKTNATLILRNYQGRGGDVDRILFNFPGKAREFVKPNGKKVSGETGNYRIRVISNNKYSNGQIFNVAL